MGRNLLLKGNSKLPAKETIPHSVKLLPINVVVSLKDVPSSMLPTLTLVALHQNNSTHRTLTRISSSFSKDNNNNNLPSNPNNNLLSNLSNSLPQDSNNLLLDSNNNNNNNLISLIPNLPKTNSLPKTHNSLPLDNSNNNLLLDNNNNLPPSNNSSLPLSHNSLLLHHSPS